MAHLFAFRFLLAAITILSIPILKAQETESKITAEVISVYNTKGYLPLTATFSPDGKFIYCQAYEGSYNNQTGRVSVSMNSKNFILDVDNNSMVADLGESEVEGMTDQNYLIISDENTILWDFENEEEVEELFEEEGKIFCSTDGRYLGLVKENGKVLVLDASLNFDPREYSVQNFLSEYSEYCLVDSATFLLVQLKDKELMVMNLINGKKLCTIPYEQNKWDNISISGNGKYMALESDSSVTFIDINNAVLSKTIELKHERRNFELSEDGQVLITSFVDGTLVLFDAQTSMINWVMGKHKASIMSIDISAKENLFVTSSLDGTIKIWRMIKNESIN